MPTHLHSNTVCVNGNSQNGGRIVSCMEQKISGWKGGVVPLSTRYHVVGPAAYVDESLFSSHNKARQIDPRVWKSTKLGSAPKIKPRLAPARQSGVDESMSTFHDVFRPRSANGCYKMLSHKPSFVDETLFGSNRGPLKAEYLNLSHVDSNFNDLGTSAGGHFSPCDYRQSYGSRQRDLFVSNKLGTSFSRQISGNQRAGSPVPSQLLNGFGGSSGQLSADSPISETSLPERPPWR